MRAIAIVMLTLAGCGGGTTTDSAAAASQQAGGPDDATVKARMEQMGQTPGSSDTVSWEYHSVQHAAPRKPTTNESVMANIPKGATVYPVRVSVTYRFNSHITDMERNFLFYRNEFGDWTGVNMATSKPDVYR